LKDHNEYFDVMKKVYEAIFELSYDDILKLFNAILALKRPTKH